MRPSFLGALVLAFGLLFGTIRDAHADANQKPRIFVEWHGSWWAAHSIRQTNDGRTVVHYDGWGTEWDEPVAGTRIAHATNDGKLFVSWGGSWWPATIVSQEKNGALRIHYDGWGNEWDETVDAGRIIHLSR